MDKINRALFFAEENSANIAELRRFLPKATRCVVMTAQNVGGAMYFGKVTSPGGAAAIVKYGDGETASLCDDGEFSVTGTSPIFAALPDGESDLYLTGEHAGAVMIAIGVL